MSAHQYNYAIVCRVPNNFRNQGSKSDRGRDLDVETAKQEHAQLVDALEKCNVKVIQLQESEEYPECVFVEDTAVVIGYTALITRPSNASRQGELGEIRKVLRDYLKLSIAEMRDPKAILDGGDVLFTGKEIFVGVGNRTNMKGAQELVKAFPEYMITPIRMDGSNVHLKGVVSMAGKDVIAVGTSPLADKICQQIDQLKQYHYKLMKLGTDQAANMLYVNGRLIHRSREEIGDSSYNKLLEKILFTKHRVSIETLCPDRESTLSSLVLMINRKDPKKIISNITEEDVAPFQYLRPF